MKIPQAIELLRGPIGPLMMRANEVANVVQNQRLAVLNAIALLESGRAHEARSLLVEAAGVGS